MDGAGSPETISDRSCTPDSRLRQILLHFACSMVLINSHWEEVAKLYIS